MGIKDLTRSQPLSVEQVLEEIDPKLRGQLVDALTKRKARSRFFVFAAREVASALADDGFNVTQHQVELWRREHVDS